MPKIIKTDRKKFERYFKDFLEGGVESKTLMVRCYNYHDSLREVLNNLYISPLIHTGIIKVRSMENNVNIFEGLAPKNKIKKITQDSILGNKDFTFQIEKRSYFEDYSDRDVQVFVPIQTILNCSKEVEKLKRFLKTTDTKTVLITTNDYGRKPEGLYDYLDEVIILDTSLESNNLEKMKNLRENISDENGKMPY